jgi:hypothetical protein
VRADLAVIAQHRPALVLVEDEVLLRHCLLHPVQAHLNAILHELTFGILGLVLVLGRNHEGVDEIGKLAVGLRVLDVVAGNTEVVVRLELVVNRADRTRNGEGKDWRSRAFWTGLVRVWKDVQLLEVPSGLASALGADLLREISDIFPV